MSALISASPSARNQPTLQNHGYGLLYHAMCLFTPQLLPGTHSRISTEGRLRLSRPGAWLPPDEFNSMIAEALFICIKIFKQQL